MQITVVISEVFAALAVERLLSPQAQEHDLLGARSSVDSIWEVEALPEQAKSMPEKHDRFPAKQLKPDFGQ